MWTIFIQTFPQSRSSPIVSGRLLGFKTPKDLSIGEKLKASSISSRWYLTNDGLWVTQNPQASGHLHSCVQQVWFFVGELFCLYPQDKTHQLSKVSFSCWALSFIFTIKLSYLPKVSLTFWGTSVRLIFSFCKNKLKLFTFLSTSHNSKIISMTCLRSS